MVIDAEVAAPRVSRMPETIGRAVLAALWLVWAAAASWSVPQPASVNQLRDDLASGGIVSYARGESLNFQRLWAAPPQIRSHQDGGVLVWVLWNGQIFYAIPDAVNSPDEPASGTGSSVGGDNSQTDRLARELAQAGIGYGGASWVTDVGSAVGLVLIVISLAILLGGPVPARGTRWFWFWVGQLPLGVGLLAWLAWERPWAASISDEVKKRSGWTGLGLLILGTIVLSVLLVGVGRLLGIFLIPV